MSELATKFRRGEIRGDSVSLHVLRGETEREFRIDGKALCEDPQSRFYGFDRFEPGLASQMLAVGRRIYPMARGDVLRADAVSGYALTRELEFVSLVTAQQPLTDLTGAMLLPMAVDQPAPYQEQYSYKKQTWTLGGRISRNYSDIGTGGGIQITRQSQPIAPLLLHAFWGLDDIARASLGNIPLPALLLQGAMRQLAETINTEIFFGDADEGIPGFYNQAGVTPVVVPPGSGGSPLWANKTADEIEADILLIINAQAAGVVEKGNLLANRLALSTTAYRKIQTTSRSQVLGMTILQYIQQIFDGEITKHPELVSGAVGNAAWMACYRYDPLVAGRLLPVPPVYLPPDIESTRITQAIHAQSGGVNSRYPVATQIYYGM